MRNGSVCMKGMLLHSLRNAMPCFTSLITSFIYLGKAHCMPSMVLIMLLWHKIIAILTPPEEGLSNAQIDVHNIDPTLM